MKLINFHIISRISNDRIYTANTKYLIVLTAHSSKKIANYYLSYGNVPITQLTSSKNDRLNIRKCRKALRILQIGSLFL